MNVFYAELIGTMLLVLLGNGVVANSLLSKTKANTSSNWILITTGWAMAVFVGVVVAAPYSGAHLNPAVTLGLAIIGKFEWNQVFLFISAQFLGGALGAFIVWIFYRDHFSATKEGDLKLACFCTSPAIKNNFSNLISEIIGSFVLIFTVFYLSGAQIDSPMGKVPVGLGSIGALPVTFLVWGIGISLGGTTGYAINPARDFPPRLMHFLLPIASKGKSDWGYAWIPVLGPILGSGLAALVYLALS